MKRYIRFVLRIPKQRPLTLGALKWPWPIKKIVDHFPEYVEIVDTKAISVIALDDITLEDLYHV